MDRTLLQSPSSPTPAAQGTLEPAAGHWVRVAGAGDVAGRTVSFAQPGVVAVVAECEEDNVASARVLQKCGMHQTGTKGSLLTWRVVADR